MRIVLLCFLLMQCASILSQNKTDAKGNKQGPWVKYHPNSKVMLYSGQFKDNHPVGEFRYFYPSGAVKAIVQHESLHHSFAWYYYENEQLMSLGKYVDQLKDSVWMNYNAGGFLVSKEPFKNNKLNGEKIIYYVANQVETGEIKALSVEHFSDSVLHGSYQAFFSSGKMKEQGNYTFGLKEGVWETFHPNGSIASRVKFKQGKAYGYMYVYDEEGEESYKVFYLKGVKLSQEALKKYLDNCAKNGITPDE